MVEMAEQRLLPAKRRRATSEDAWPSMWLFCLQGTEQQLCGLASHGLFQQGTRCCLLYPMEHAMVVVRQGSMDDYRACFAEAGAQVTWAHDPKQVVADPAQRSDAEQALWHLESRGSPVGQPIPREVLRGLRLLLHPDSEWQGLPSLRRRVVRPPPRDDPAIGDMQAVSKMYVFLFQGLWVEHWHFRVLSMHPRTSEGPLLGAIEQDVELQRATMWIKASRHKRREVQQATARAMLELGAPDRGILGFLWRHPECRRPGIVCQAVVHHKFSSTFGRAMEDEWLCAYDAWAQRFDGAMSDEDEHEGVLGL